LLRVKPKREDVQNELLLYIFQLMAAKAHAFGSADNQADLPAVDRSLIVISVHARLFT
jgi:hypothetical protein